MLYPEKQIETAVELASLLVKTYNLLDVIGHEDISPGRKFDPGPAFPMESFKSKVMGRQSDSPPLYLTADVLNIRSGPGTQNAPVTGSPLPKATRVEVFQTQSVWRFVHVRDTVNGNAGMQGWVHGQYLVRIP
jgi:N-acetylmuramoyl-L-alanine amidase